MLTQAVESYLGVRRAMGFALHSEGSLLQSFAKYSDAAGKSHVCNETAIQWAGVARSATTRARRLGQVIRFARYLRAEDQRHEIPPAVFGCEKGPRPVPYIFSVGNVKRLVEAASGLGRRNPFRGQTYSTFLALLACTGLRVSEAIKLRFEDVTADGLIIRCSKFRKSRMVPLHSTAQIGLERYIQKRRPFAPLDSPGHQRSAQGFALARALKHANHRGLHPGRSVCEVGSAGIRHRAEVADWTIQSDGSVDCHAEGHPGYAERKAVNLIANGPLGAGLSIKLDSALNRLN